jgi:hypothetical protein
LILTPVLFFPPAAQTSALVVFKKGGGAEALLAAAANGNVLEFFPSESDAPHGLKGKAHFDTLSMRGAM